MRVRKLCPSTLPQNHDAGISKVCCSPGSTAAWTAQTNSKSSNRDIIRMKRFNFELDFNQDLSEQALASLKPGDAVEVDRRDADKGILVKMGEEMVLGVLPSEALDTYHPKVAFEGFVRSLVRKEGSVTKIWVCVSPCKRKRDEIPRWERETIDEDWLLKTQDYESLGAFLRLGSP